MQLSSVFALVRAGIIAAPLSACSTLGYYGHLAHGEYALLAARQPIARVIADPDADPQLKLRLRLVRDARDFASTTLQLPHNRSYTTYADLQRPYATWNVYAAPEFSVEPLHHCFLLVGCLAYRGYFDRRKAEDEAARLRTQGYETWISGSAAYSTLGWFADPILNTMLRNDDDTLASTIFHELAHQQLYVKGDTQFNESFATFVQREGLRQWRRARGVAARDDSASNRDAQFTKLVLALRERLRALYAQTLPTEVMRTRKHEEIERLRADYFRLRDTQWNGIGEYDNWVNAEINNAKLVPFGIYDGWVPAFAAMYWQSDGDWKKFYAAAQTVGRLSPAVRAQALEQLAHDAH